MTAGFAGLNEDSMITQFYLLKLHFYFQMFSHPFKKKFQAVVRLCS